MISGFRNDGGEKESHVMFPARSRRGEQSIVLLSGLVLPFRQHLASHKGTHSSNVKLERVELLGRWRRRARGVGFPNLSLSLC